MTELSALSYTQSSPRVTGRCAGDFFGDYLSSLTLRRDSTLNKSKEFFSFARQATRSFCRFGKPAIITRWRSTNAMMQLCKSDGTPLTYARKMLLSWIHSKRATRCSNTRVRRCLIHAHQWRQLMKRACHQLPSSRCPGSSRNVFRSLT